MRRRLIYNTLGFLLPLLMFLISCNNRVLYDKTKDIGEEGWKAGEKVGFVVDIDDTLSVFDFYINVRNSVDYNYSNFFFFLKTIFPDGRYAVDTVNLWLAKPDGEWLGSGFGKYRDNKILFKRQGRFPMKGKYRFEFDQAMREKILTGIKSLGIRIEYSEIKEK